MHQDKDAAHSGRGSLVQSILKAEPSCSLLCKISFSTFSVLSLSSSVSQAVKQRCTYSFMAWGQSWGLHKHTHWSHNDSLSLCSMLFFLWITSREHRGFCTYSLKHRNYVAYRAMHQVSPSLRSSCSRSCCYRRHSRCWSGCGGSRHSICLLTSSKILTGHYIWAFLDVKLHTSSSRSLCGLGQIYISLYHQPTSTNLLIYSIAKVTWSCLK